MIEILSIYRFFGYTIHTMDSRRKMRFVRCLLKLDLRDLDNGRTANLTMLLQKGRSLRRNTHAESRGQERPGVSRITFLAVAARGPFRVWRSAPVLWPAAECLRSVRMRKIVGFAVFAPSFRLDVRTASPAAALGENSVASCKRLLSFSSRSYVCT